ncbi:MAG TPA: twin-arginine translocase subunit TatC [Streptosporangiaceae bacterium]|jgi:sec-independent protein translocase protein TatC
MTKLPDTVTGARMLGSRMLAIGRASNPEGRMPLMEHIRELRSRIMRALFALIIGTGIGLIPWVFDRIWNFTVHPYVSAVTSICASKPKTAGCGRLDYQLVVNGILDSFTIRIEVAFYFALIVTSPVWLYQLWAFIAPGLYSREKRWTYAFVGAAAPLFAIGAALSYLVMSRGLRFFLGIAPAHVTVLPQIGTYIGYVTAMILGFGLTFELPLALVVLNFARVLTHERFRKWRRVMIFAVFVFAGIATPSPDPITMLLLAAPCVILVEVAELIIWGHDRSLARSSPYANLRDDEAAPLDDMDHLDDLDDDPRS